MVKYGNCKPRIVSHQTIINSYEKVKVYVNGQSWYWCANTSLQCKYIRWTVPIGSANIMSEAILWCVVITGQSYNLVMLLYISIDKHALIWLIDITHALLCKIVTNSWLFFNNTLRPRQNDRRFADDIFKRIFLNENVRIAIEISMKFVPNGRINNNPALVQIMAWRRSGDKPLSEPMMVSLLTHICVTRPQWDNIVNNIWFMLQMINFTDQVSESLAKTPIEFNDDLGEFYFLWNVGEWRPQTLRKSNELFLCTWFWT